MFLPLMCLKRSALFRKINLYNSDHTYRGFLFPSVSCFTNCNCFTSSNLLYASLIRHIIHYLSSSVLIIR